MCHCAPRKILEQSIRKSVCKHLENNAVEASIKESNMYSHFQVTYTIDKEQEIFSVLSQFHTSADKASYVNNKEMTRCHEDQCVAPRMPVT